MTKQRWFKIALGVWIGSVPFMFLMAILGDWLERTLRPADTLAQFNMLMTTPTPPIIIAARLAQVLAGFYMFLGWIPVIILGFMKGPSTKK